MNILQVNPTNSTPGILLNPEEGLIELKGKSVPENAMIVYDPVLNWLEEYSTNAKDKTILNFKLEYFNTSSSKYILQILKSLKNLKKINKQIEINWYFDDEDIKDLAQDYQELIGEKFNFFETFLKP